MFQFLNAFMGLCCFAFCFYGGKAQAHKTQATDNSSWRLPPFSAQKTKSVRSAFWKHWGDGKAELNGYKGFSERYGTRRPAQAVLIFVTETLNKKNYIKDDFAKGNNGLPVLKLNSMLKFKTGIYPYSVMTSVFSPMDVWDRQAFSAVKITLSVQEWCGHVFYGLWPSLSSFHSKMISYFQSEGEQQKKVSVPQNTLYEDELWIQLRELGGSFNQGKDWKGWIVPNLWLNRKLHQELKAVRGSISRKTFQQGTKKIHRFTIQYNDYWLKMDIDTASPHTLLGWKTSRGDQFALQGVSRLPYWSLHDLGDEKYLKKIGL